MGPNVVFVTIDTLRADRLGTYGYFRNTSPALDALASESLVFENCYAPMATTFPSHLSLFTSTYPNETGSVANVGVGGPTFQPTEHLRTLAQFFKDGGYETAAFVSATPLKKSSGMSAGFDTFREPKGESRRAATTNAEAFAWLEKAQAPFLLWVHYYDPHAPYDPPEPFSEVYHDSPELKAYLDERDFAPAEGSGLATELVNNRYDGEVSYVDRQTGALLEVLKTRSSRWDETIVVVLGDHGEGLRQHGELAHGGIWGEQLRVPLLMRVPGREPARVDRLMSIVDVVPTLMGLVDLPGEDAFRRQASGQDRFSIDPDSDETFIFSQESSAPWKQRPEGPRYVLTGADWKYVDESPIGEKLFHLPTDPYELVDVSNDYPEIAARLRAVLLKRVETQKEKWTIYQATRSAKDVEIDPAILEELRSLGYIE